MAIRICRAKLAEVAADLQGGETSPAEYAEECCDRIDELDAELRSFLPEPNRHDRLREEAEALQDRFPDPENRPPLFGVPVGVKDIIHVEGFETRAGTALPPELFAGPEAACVERLCEAGALVLGKTYTTEFAGMSPAPTRNPHDLNHTPGGSSSGSAAAVAAGLCPLALGTQTGGSVIRPASFCGIVGLKPSFGRIPRDGVLERSESADHVGTFTQDVAGAEIAASVLCEDWGETTGSAGPAGPADPDGFPTIGIPEGGYLDHATEEAQTAFRSGMKRLEEAGCSVERVTVPTFENFEALDRRHRRLTAGELALVHQEWFDEYRALYRTASAETIDRGREVTVGELAEGRASRLELRAELDDLMADHDLDLWAAPAAPGPAPASLGTTGDPVMNRPWTHAGLPVVTLPAKTTDDGLPIGIQFAAPFGADEKLLAWAGRIEGTL